MRIGVGSRRRRGNMGRRLQPEDEKRIDAMVRAERVRVLREGVEAGTYKVDPDAVAAALAKRAGPAKEA